MLTDLPIIYWDACVLLSYINGIKDRLPDIEGLMQKSGKDFNLITSVFSVVEVAKAKEEQDKKALDTAIEAKISKLWQLGSPIQLVEFYELIAVKARTLMRNAIPEGWSLKPADAIHLATADHLKVTNFHTYDEKLDKYQKITETHFTIGRPIAAQPVLSLATVALAPAPVPETTAEPAAIEAMKGASDEHHAEGKADATTAQTNNKREADSAHPTAVQRSDSGRAQGEAAGEAKAETEKKI